MKNHTWTHDNFTLTLLPCKTIHLEITEDDGSITFDKIDTINVFKNVDPEYGTVSMDLVLNAPQISYEFQDLGDQFIAETKGLFPLSDPTPVSHIEILLRVVTEDGYLKKMIFIEDNQLKLRQITPGGDALETVLS